MPLSRGLSQLYVKDREGLSTLFIAAFTGDAVPSYNVDTVTWVPISMLEE